MALGCGGGGGGVDSSSAGDMGSSARRLRFVRLGVRVSSLERSGTAAAGLGTFLRSVFFGRGAVVLGAAFLSGARRFRPRFFLGGGASLSVAGSEEGAKRFLVVGGGASDSRAFSIWDLGIVFFFFDLVCMTAVEGIVVMMGAGIEYEDSIIAFFCRILGGNTRWCKRREIVT